MKNKRLAVGCLIMLLAGGPGLGFIGWMIFGNHSRYVTGAKDHEFADPSAGPIDYYENRNISGLQVVTYAVAEDEFKPFAERHGWKLEWKPEGAIIPTPAACAAGDFSFKPLGPCWYYEDRRSNGGGISVAFVPGSSRAYIYKTSR
ncbi:hypothetical protein [Luteolibacter luteus]|uniref:Uncharacterized protein n=1 Tax=Luteolibacter luteus TaxID=2728835 RepID=A0A858RKL2_9BACT|nr:hypothetical protein [Luteolibacter luteus]QJE97392.1 hypothetical protein HHL09_16900 [Luteolibacter luteus]